MNPPLTPEKILQTGLAFWASKTLLSAIEIGVFTELAQGPEPLTTLAGRLGLHPRSARDFLDTLVALGFLQRDGDRYRNTVETDLFLDRKKPSYVGGILEMANHRLYPFWGHLTTALRTGLPQNEIRTGDPNLFEALYADPARLNEAVEAALVEGDDPVVVMSHWPDAFATAPDRVAITFAGHSHCGQVNLPVFGRLMHASPGSEKWPCGLYSKGQGRLYVSGGVGVSIVPVRFNQPPEIAVVTLRAD